MNSSFLRRFPHLSSRNHQTISELPTPLVTVPQLGQHAWLKQDNLSHSEYGGNKLRKLDFIAADIVAQQKSHVVSFGAIGTNAGVATAMMCQQLGLACTLFLFDQPVTTTVSNNLKRMLGYGARLIYCGSLSHTLLRFFCSPQRLDRNSYFLWAGCSNPPAILAYVSAVFELQQQLQAQGLPHPGHIVVPVGSGGTAAGLYLGLQLTGLNSTLVPVRVAPARLGPFDACSDKTVNRMIRQAAGLLQLDDRNLPRARLVEGYYGAGYGHAGPRVEQAIDTFSAAGIHLEGTYSGKAACAFLDLLTQQSSQQPVRPVLFWNTYNSSDYIPDADLRQLPLRLQRRLADAR